MVNSSFLRYLLVLLYAVSISFLYWFLYQFPRLGIDDANIYFTYVKNFVQGNGFVYNLGGERVEGFTSALWVLFISPAYFMGPYFETLVLVLNVFIVSVVFFASMKFINRLTSQKTFFNWYSLLFLAVISVTPGYIDWTVLSLMETGLWGLLLVGITLELCSSSFDRRVIRNFSILIALLVLTRPESILWGVFFIFLLAVQVFLETHRAKTIKHFLIVPVLTFAIVIAALTVFRMMYFGYPLPNTFYAKVSSDLFYNIFEGIKYFVFSLYQSPLIALVLISIFLSLLFIGRKVYIQKRDRDTISLSARERIQLVLVSVSTVSLLIPIYVGGDHFQLLRFNQPFIPIYLFTFFNLAFWRSIFEVHWKLKLNVPFRVVLFSLVLVFFYFLTKTPLHTYIKHGSPIVAEFRMAESGRREGEDLNRLFSELDALPSIGVSAAGGFAYTYQGNVIDLMGLNNVAMAHASKVKVGMKNHASFNKAVFYDQAPDMFNFILYRDLASVPSTIDALPILSDYAAGIYSHIFSEPQFKEIYSPAIIYNKGDNSLIAGYCSNRFIENLNAHGIAVKKLQLQRQLIQYKPFNTQ